MCTCFSALQAIDELNLNESSTYKLSYTGFSRGAELNAKWAAQRANWIAYTSYDRTKLPVNAVLVYDEFQKNYYVVNNWATLKKHARNIDSRWSIYFYIFGFIADRKFSQKRKSQK